MKETIKAVLDYLDTYYTVNTWVRQEFLARSPGTYWYEYKRRDRTLLVRHDLDNTRLQIITHDEPPPGPLHEVEDKKLITDFEFAKAIIDAELLNIPKPTGWTTLEMADPGDHVRLKDGREALVVSQSDDYYNDFEPVLIGLRTGRKLPEFEGFCDLNLMPILIL